MLRADARSTCETGTSWLLTLEIALAQAFLVLGLYTVIGIQETLVAQGLFQLEYG